MVDELRFDGKTVIVTGGGRGFGRGHAMDFGRRGANVVIADYGMELDGTGWDAGTAEAAVQEIRDAGGEATAVFANCAIGPRPSAWCRPRSTPTASSTCW